MPAEDVQNRMASIMKLFMEARTLAETTSDPGLLEKQLENFDTIYRSVAYEAASMALALRDLENGSKLTGWNEFAQKNSGMHASQIHVGLGWAIAQKKINASGILKGLNPLMRARVADGCGYYNDIFRQHASINNKTVPDDFIDCMDGYDQGIGRSVYYTTKGDIEKISGHINAFPETRQASLWRGVAIACAYVGGSDEKTMHAIFEYSGAYKMQMKIGAALVARARYDAESITPDVQAACDCWCNKNFSTLVDITKKTEKVTLESNGSYQDWLNKIAGELLQ